MESEMLVKKIALYIVISLTWLASVAHAGSEDWNGTFTIRTSNGQEYSIQHTPTHVYFLIFQIGKCLHLHEGASINGLRIPEDINLCTASNVDNFAKEVEKLGIILNESIEQGPTYFS